jgi:Flp pilus assembly protein TadB
VVYATVSSSYFLWILIGLAVGLWGTVWWELLRKSKKLEYDSGNGDGVANSAADDQQKQAAEYRSVVLRRCAVAYFVIILICFVVALVAGGEGIAVLVAINVVVAAIVVLRSWPPDRRKYLLKELPNLYRSQDS